MVKRGLSRLSEEWYRDKSGIMRIVVMRLLLLGRGLGGRRRQTAKDLRSNELNLKKQTLGNLS